MTGWRGCAVGGRRAFYAGVGALVFALSASPAGSQTGYLAEPQVFVGLFLDGCVATAPDFDGAEAVFEQAGLLRSRVIFDRALFTGPSNVVSAVIEDKDGQRLCRVVGQGLDETAAALALRERLLDAYGALLTEERTADGAIVFTAPATGGAVVVTVTPAEASEDARALLTATMEF